MLKQSLFRTPLWDCRQRSVLKKSKAFAPTEPAKVAKLLGTPRSHLFVEQLGSRVRLWYIVESSNSDMSRAFNKAQS